MSTLLDDVRLEIIELHDFFVEWFNGTADPTSLQTHLNNRLSSNIVFIPPDGNILHIGELIAGFTAAYGANTDFRIQIRDVEICQEMDAHIMVTYTEWQVGANDSELSQNARLTSVLMTKCEPRQWLHVQETWLPESVRAAGRFDF